MVPTLISGDLALVDHGKNYLDPQGGIYAISIDSQIMVKRLQIVFPGKHIKIISDNQFYPSIEISPQDLIINGKIIWYGREIDG